MRSQKNYEFLQSKVDCILAGSTTKTAIKELALQINRSFKENYLVAYCKEKRVCQ